jgi:hypothetical protein
MDFEVGRGASVLLATPYGFDQSPTFGVVARETPLGPLFVLADSHLIKQRSARRLPEPPSGRALADPLIAVVRRTYAVFYVTNQAPASRVEWYTRWHGEDKLTRHLGIGLTPDEWRKELHRLQEIGCPVYMGKGIGYSLSF